MDLRADHSNLLHEELLSNTKADKQWVSGMKSWTRTWHNSHLLAEDASSSPWTPDSTYQGFANNRY